MVDEQRDGSGRPPGPWVPPDAGAAADAAVGRDRSAPSGAWSEPVAGIPDGPPPPPWERERRSRRRWVLLGLAALLVLGIPIGLAIAGTLARSSDEEVAGGDDGDVPAGEDAPEDDGSALDPPDAPADPLDAPDLDRLAGPDAIFAELLLDIDASELAMLGFQDQVAAAFRDHGGQDATELLGSLSAAGTSGAEELEAAREALEQPVGDVRAEAVREVYLDHLDSWLRYMQAVADDPTLFAPERDSARYTLSINASAEAFARSLEDQLPDDVDPEVALMAEQLLDRGFRATGDADV
jgi:hypothetical protein